MFNPLRATDKIHNDFFDFFETSFSPNNPRLAEEFRVLRDRGYIWRSPYISVSQPYEEGMIIQDFVKAHRLSPYISEGFGYIKRLYSHQEHAITNVLKGNPTIVASGTGSGKTEVFLIPILDHLIKHRDTPGVKVIIVYPMNALANDQTERLRKILFAINRRLGRKITFASYTGNTAEVAEEIVKMAELCPEPGCGKNLYPEVKNGRSILKCERNPAVTIDYQVLSRKEIRQDPPDILITNYVELEYLLLRKKDETLFSSSNLRFVVLDEIHSYTGAQGIDVAFLVRRLKRRVRPRIQGSLTFVGTSATLSSKKNEKERRNEVAQFALSLFGETFREEDVFEGRYEPWRFTDSNDISVLQRLLDTSVENLEVVGTETFRNICEKLSSEKFPDAITNRRIFAGKLLLSNPFFQTLLHLLAEPRDRKELVDSAANATAIEHLVEPFRGRPEQLEEIMWDYLRLGSLSSHPQLSDPHNDVPLIRINVHNFFKTIDDLYICHRCRTIYNSPMDTCEKCSSSVDRLGVCRFCGQDFFISIINADDFKAMVRSPLDSQITSTIDESPEQDRIRKLPYNNDLVGTVELWQTYRTVQDSHGGLVATERKKCVTCGSIGLLNDTACHFCGSTDLIAIHIVARSRIARSTQPLKCPFCGNRYGRFSALSPISMSSNTASTTLFDIAFAALPSESRKMLIFTDNKQAAAYLAGYLEMEHRSHAMRKLIYNAIMNEYDGRGSFSEARESVLGRIGNWYGGDFERFHVREEDFTREFAKEISSVAGAQRSLENLGLLAITYVTLEKTDSFRRDWESWKSGHSNGVALLIPDDDFETLRKYLISFLYIIRQGGAMKGIERKARFERGNAVGYSLRKDNRDYIGIQIKNMTSTSGSIALLTRKSFQVEEDNTEPIIESAYDYLVSRALLVRSTISKGRSKAEAYVVNSSKIILRVPESVKLCNICKSVCAYSPGSICLTYRCEGTTGEVSYSEWLNADRPNYYIKLYTTGDPLRMVTREDTGALDLNERREIETSFKSDDPNDRTIDVIVATPTLELGVDIGDLLSVGLFKSPPAPVNYVQRVGRAGRKERVSLNNAFMFSNPIDIYYYYHPAQLIRGEITTPVIDVENDHMLRRHASALILEDLFVFSPLRDSISEDMRNFVERDDKQAILKQVIARNDIILTKIKDAFSDLTVKRSDSQVESLLINFEGDLTRSVRDWEDEVKRYEAHAKGLSDQMRGKPRSEYVNLDKQHDRLTDHIRELEGRNILQHFMNSGLLPRYAFPGVYVNIEEEWGRETFGGQNRNYAISEYAPGSEVTLKKRIYDSVGVDFRFSKPRWTRFSTCSACKTFISESDFRQCLLCHQAGANQPLESLAPETILLRGSNKPINEPREYREALLDVFFNFNADSSIHPAKVVDNFVLKKLGNVEIVQIVSGILHEDEPEPRPIELCMKCGRARGSLREGTHLELGSRDRCNGQFQRVRLHHSMPTNVISLAINGDSLYGVPLKKPFDKLLMTLKNAIINAAQILTRADDGEIEGVVKNRELFLYDNVEGGVGYVNQVFDRFDEVILQAADMVLNPDDQCEKGCVKCLYSFRRKRDISKIDKALVRPILERARVFHADSTLKGKGERNSFKGSEITTIVSPAFSFSGAIELKNVIRAAQSEIKITSLYITDGQIDWPDEGRRSWVDILTSIKLDRGKAVKITAVVRQPTSDDHRRALRKLAEAGIEVLVYRKQIEEQLLSIVSSTLPGIVHSKLVVVDPQNPSTRYAVIGSANFSPEMWKNHETYNFGKDEEWVKGTYQAITKLEGESKRVELRELLTSEGVSSIVVAPGDKPGELEELGYRLARASQEVLIMDPYLTREFETLEYLARWVRKSVPIKIITARVDSGKLKRALDDYRGKGYNIEKVLRYFDREKKTGKDTILHDRYILIDGKTVLRLGKGINTLIEAGGYHSSDNVLVDIMEIPSLVENYVRNFQGLWNYQNNPSEIVRNFPKEVY